MLLLTDEASKNVSQSCWCALTGHQMSLYVEHMACLLLVPCAPMSIVCPLPSRYPIIVTVAPAVSPSLPSFVSLFSLLVSVVLCWSVVFRCVCVMLTVQTVFCLPVFLLRGGFCCSLFYYSIPISSALESSPHLSLSSRTLTKCFPVDFKYVQRDSVFAVSGQKYVFVPSTLLGCSSNLMSTLHKSSKEVLLKHSLHRMFNASQRWHTCIYTLHML